MRDESNRWLDPFKRLTARLRGALKEHGVNLGHREALDVLAHALNNSGWRTTRGQLLRGERLVEEAVVQGRWIDPPNTLWSALDEREVPHALLTGQPELIADAFAHAALTAPERSLAVMAADAAHHQPQHAVEADDPYGPRPTVFVRPDRQVTLSEFLALAELARQAERALLLDAEATDILLTALAARDERVANLSLPLLMTVPLPMQLTWERHVDWHPAWHGAMRHPMLADAIQHDRLSVLDAEFDIWSRQPTADRILLTGETTRTVREIVERAFDIELPDERVVEWLHRDARTAGLLLVHGLGHLALPPLLWQAVGEDLVGHVLPALRLDVVTYVRVQCEQQGYRVTASLS